MIESPTLSGLIDIVRRTKTPARSTPHGVWVGEPHGSDIRILYAPRMGDGEVWDMNNRIHVATVREGENPLIHVDIDNPFDREKFAKVLGLKRKEEIEQLYPLVPVEKPEEIPIEGEGEPFTPPLRTSGLTGI